MVRRWISVGRSEMQALADLISRPSSRRMRWVVLVTGLLRRLAAASTPDL